MSEAIVIAAITAVCSGGLGAAIVAYFKDRKKDNAAAKLTDVEALQKQVLLLTTIVEFLRRENSQLQNDYVTSEDKNRKMRMHISELEEELQRVKLTVARTQEQCDHLSSRLKKLANGGNSES